MAVKLFGTYENEKKDGSLTFKVPKELVKQFDAYANEFYDDRQDALRHMFFEYYSRLPYKRGITKCTGTVLLPIVKSQEELEEKMIDLNHAIMGRVTHNDENPLSILNRTPLLEILDNLDDADNPKDVLKAMIKTDTSDLITGKKIIIKDDEDENSYNPMRDIFNYIYSRRFDKESISKTSKKEKRYFEIQKKMYGDKLKRRDDCIENYIEITYNFNNLLDKPSSNMFFNLSEKDVFVDDEIETHVGLNVFNIDGLKYYIVTNLILIEGSLCTQAWLVPSKLAFMLCMNAENYDLGKMLEKIDDNSSPYQTTLEYEEKRRDEVFNELKSIDSKIKDLKKHMGKK